jgi:hypothetical protein
LACASHLLSDSLSTPSSSRRFIPCRQASAASSSRREVSSPRTTRRQRALATQHGEHRFGNEAAVGMAEFAMLAKIVGNDQVGRESRAQQFGQQRFGVAKKGGSKTRGACGHCGSWLISMAVATCT